MNRIEKMLNNVAKKKSDAPELTLVTNETPFAIRQAYKALYTNILYLNVDDKCIAEPRAPRSWCSHTPLSFTRLPFR